MKHKKIRYINRRTGDIDEEHPPGEAYLRFLYSNPFGVLPLHLVVKRKFLSSFYGNLMQKSKSKKKIQLFVKNYSIDMSESEKNISEFISFNDFFIRRLKSNARSIEKGIISPADGKILAFSDIGELNNFFVKGNQFNLERYLCSKQLAEEFQHSSICIIRLAPNDYHRFHFPFAGVTSHSVKIKGSYFSVSPLAVANNFARVFCENKREYTILKTKDKGNMLISPVGATMVGSITMTYQERTAVKKGDEMGFFSFGGSSIVLLIKKDKIKIDYDLLINTRKGLETKIRMGEKIGI
jgi:phosphatidylserine decarboxylase